jgi:probable rRNA maturation factor
VSGAIGSARSGRMKRRESGPRDVILNRQRSVRIPKSQLENFLARARQALRLPAGSLAVALVTNAEIAKWNRAYRHKDGPTDVLSFPSDAAPESPDRLGRRHTHRVPGKKVAPVYLGDIAIAPGVARRNARLFGRTFSQEMRILVLHGMLHLMGYDHETDTGQMERRERKLRRRLGIG